MIVWLIVVFLALILTFVRFIVGPSFFDRIVAFDTMTTIVISVFVLVSLTIKKSFLLDVALVYSILAFVGIIAIIRYFERET